MEDFCANYLVCAVHHLQDPNSLPNNGFFPVAQWYASFVTYLFFQDVWVAFGVTTIIMAARYFMLYILSWARIQFVYDLLLTNQQNRLLTIDYSDIWVGAVLILSGIFIAHLLCYVLHLPLIVRDPWALYDKITEQRVPVSICPPNSRQEYFWHRVKYYVFLAMVQYAGTALMLLLGLISDRSLEYAVVLYFVLQVLLIVLYTAFGYKSKIEQTVVWRSGLLRYGLFVLLWSVVFLVVYGSVFLLRDWCSVVIILMTVTLLLSVVLIPLAIVRFFISSSGSE